MKGQKQFALIERALVDGTLREMFPDVSDEHWSFWVYAQFFRADKTALVFPGAAKASEGCRYPFEKHGLANASGKEKTAFLYDPLVANGLAVEGSRGARNGVSFQKYIALSAPTRALDGTLVLGKPFTRAWRDSAQIPFVELPAALFKGPWAAMSDAERRCLCALYAFLTPDCASSDPNHLRIERGRMVTSQAFERAAGAHGDSAMGLFQSLKAKGAVSIVPAGLAEVPIYPGSRPPLIVSERGDLSTHLVNPTLGVPPKRAPRKASQ
jgi:hypothetical protein